jgi:hypothetical protein
MTLRRVNGPGTGITDPRVRFGELPGWREPSRRCIGTELERVGLNNLDQW